NTIGEGANEVLKAFIALVGMREIGEGLKSTLEGMKRPGSFLPTLWSFTRDHFGKLVKVPTVPVATPMLRPMGSSLSRRVARFGARVGGLRCGTGEAVRENHSPRGRAADAASPLFPPACPFPRGDLPKPLGRAPPAERSAAELSLCMANRRFDESLHALSS